MISKKAALQQRAEARASVYRQALRLVDGEIRFASRSRQPWPHDSWRVIELKTAWRDAAVETWTEIQAAIAKMATQEDR